MRSNAIYSMNHRFRGGNDVCVEHVSHPCVFQTQMNLEERKELIRADLSGHLERKKKQESFVNLSNHAFTER